MTTPYNKPALSFRDQLNKLISRGLIIQDRTAALKKLESISYYRLSAYLYPFRQRNQTGILSQYIPNTSWEQIIELYEFDRQLRLLLLDAIERIEVAVRTQLTYHFSHRHGPFGHTDPTNFHPQFKHQEWIVDVRTETERSSDKFIDHYKSKYDGFPSVPLWMLTEVMSLGSLSRLYRGLNHKDKLPISDYFDTHHKRLTDWLHTLTYIRNVCAHHSRLWNRELSIRPDVTKDANWRSPITPRNDRIFYILLILRCLQRASGNGDDWTAAVNQLLAPIAAHKHWKVAMGMPDDWHNHPLWR